MYDDFMIQETMIFTFPDFRLRSNSQKNERLRGKLEAFWRSKPPMAMNIFPCICPALLIETQEIGKVTTNIANSTRETRSQVNRSGWLKIACIYNVIVEDFVEDAKSTSQINKALKTDKIGKVGVNVEEK